MGRYLDRLPSHQALATRRARMGAIRTLPSTGLLVLRGLLATTGLVTATLTHPVVGDAADRVASSTGEGCLSGSLEAMTASPARGRARLCAAQATSSGRSI